MRACAREDDGVALQTVDQQEVATDMALAVVGPVTLERVIKPFGPQWGIVGDEQQHRFLQPLQVVAARAREAFPVFEKGLGVVARLGRRCPFTACGLLRAAWS